MSVLFNQHQGLVIVNAELFGPTGSAVLQLALDTGATSTLVSLGMLIAIGYDPGLESNRIQLTTGSGVEFVPRVILNKISALEKECLNFCNGQPYVEHKNIIKTVSLRGGVFLPTKQSR
jgi:hypothetical protein